LSYLPQREAIDLSDALGHLLRSKGWIPFVWRPASDMVVRLAKAGEDRSLGLRARGWTAEATIRRAVEVTSAEGRLLRLKDDAYLVTLLIQEESARDGNGAEASTKGAPDHER
jgi:hypothetical protein